MIQSINLHKGQVVTKGNVRDILNRAKGNYDYAKFTTESGKYISVTFTKDNKYEIATNHRDYTLFYDIKVLKTVYSFDSLVDFVFRWILRLNKI